MQILTKLHDGGGVLDVVISGCQKSISGAWEMALIILQDT